MTDPVWRTVDEVALLFDVQPRTVRMWARRGHVTITAGRLDLRQVLDWYDHHRDASMDRTRRGGLAVTDRTRVTCEPSSACPETATDE